MPQSGDLIAYTGTNTVYNPMEFRHLTSQDFKVGLRYAFGMPSYAQLLRPRRRQVLIPVVSSGALHKGTVRHIGGRCFFVTLAAFAAIPLDRD